MVKRRVIKLFSLAFLFFFIFLMIISSSLDRLENEIITKSGFKVVSVGQYEFGRGGVVLVALDEGGDGILKAAVEFPVLKRVVKLQEIEFEFEEIPLEFIAESWSGKQLVSYREGKLNEITKGDGFGFVSRLLRWFFMVQFIAFLIVYGPILAQHFRNKKNRSIEHG